MTDESELAEARVGTTLNDKWTLERLLGVGGMAAVYEARHRNEARAAIKLLHPSLAQHPSIRERFVHEGYAANRVEHPDVVKVLDDGVIEGGPEAGTPFLVMELLEGRSLEARRKEKPPVSDVEFLEIARSVLSVLESAHARGIVHRDLKPENIFLVAGEGIRVKVLDFGIARTVESRGQTMHGVPMGTPAFMAPEQAAGRVDEIDGRTDLFALGASGFTLLSGRTAHEGDNTLDVMSKMAKEQVPPLRSVASKVSEPCARVIDRALMLRREDRYADATAMREDVEAALEELRPKPAPVSDPAIEPERGGGGCVWVLVVALLLGSIAVFTWLTWRGDLFRKAPHPVAANLPDAAVAEDASTVPDAADAAVEDASVADAGVLEDAAVEDAALEEQDASMPLDASVSVVIPKPATSTHPHPGPTHPKPKPKPHPR